VWGVLAAARKKNKNRNIENDFTQTQKYSFQNKHQFVILGDLVIC
jgi:hypothetical protein